MRFRDLKQKVRRFIVRCFTPPSPPSSLRITEIRTFNVVGIIERHEANNESTTVLWFACNPDTKDHYGDSADWDKFAKNMRQRGYKPDDITKGKELLLRAENFAKVLRERGYKFDTYNERIVNPSPRGK